MPLDPANPQTQFDQAFAEAALPAAPVPNAWDTLPHYPSPRYVEKNLAPEKTLTYGDVSDLAAARKHAEDAGVLSPALGASMLPMAMVEGRSGNYGINTSLALSPKPSTLKRFRDMGLTVTDKTDPAEIDKRRYDYEETPKAGGPTQYYRRLTVQGPNGPMEAGQLVDPSWGHMVIDKIAGKPGKFLMPSGETTDGSNARMMAAILAEKAATYGEKAAVERYNGSGTAVEKADGREQLASSAQYVRKVDAARQMLAHPRNAALTKYYNSVYSPKGR